MRKDIWYLIACFNCFCFYFLLVSCFTPKYLPTILNTNTIRSTDHVQLLLGQFSQQIVSEWQANIILLPTMFFRLFKYGICQKSLYFRQNIWLNISSQEEEKTLSHPGIHILLCNSEDFATL